MTADHPQSTKEALQVHDAIDRSREKGFDVVFVVWTPDPRGPVGTSAKLSDMHDPQVLCATYRSITLRLAEIARAQGMDDVADQIESVHAHAVKSG